MARVNELQTPKLVVGLDAIPNIAHSGQAYINGPLVVGSPLVPTAALAINLPTVPSLGLYSAQQNAIGLKIISPTTGFIVTAPASIINGILTTNGIKVVNGTKTTNGLDTKNGLSVKNDVAIGNGKKIENSGQITNGGTVLNGGAVINGGLAVNGAITGNISACTGKKDFDIPHPNKEGWRLRHVCIEGPTADVYFRGRLENTNVIKIPEYWKGLVDLETIDISLTPIGSYQELFVEKIEWGTNIIVKNNAGGSVNCSYIVYGERIDTSKNIPEYEGEYMDYPGDNSEYTGGTYWNSKTDLEGVTPPVDTDPET